MNRGLMMPTFDELGAHDANFRVGLSLHRELAKKEREKSMQKAKLKLAKERVGPTSFLIERVTRVYSSIYDRSPLV